MSKNIDMDSYRLGRDHALNPKGGLFAPAVSDEDDPPVRQERADEVMAGTLLTVHMGAAIREDDHDGTHETIGPLTAKRLYAEGWRLVRTASKEQA